MASGVCFGGILETVGDRKLGLVTNFGKMRIRVLGFWLMHVSGSLRRGSENLYFPGLDLNVSFSRSFSDGLLVVLQMDFLLDALF